MYNDTVSTARPEQLSFLESAQATAPDMSEIEALTAILSDICGNRNPEKTAAALLDNFGSFKSIIEARPEALATVTTEGNASKISALLPILRAIIRTENEQPEQIRNRKELESFCKSLLMGERIEKFCVICVNAQCKVIGTRCISTGSISEVSAYPRLVVETALNYNAHSVFFTHNHPGGTCAPSAEDIASTLRLKKLLNGLGIQVLDHLIVAGACSYSMAQHGDITF